MAEVKITIDKKALADINNKIQTAVFKTAEALHSDVIQQQVMPFRTGHMQNEATTVKQKNKSTASLITNTPYARRLYYHPEYNFRTTDNPRATGLWLEEWETGTRKNFCTETFTTLLRREMG